MNTVLQFSQFSTVLKRLLLGSTALGLVALTMPAAALAASFLVTQATDDATGATPGTLSWAILQANGSPGNEIFIDPSVTAIAVTGTLPAFGHPTTLTSLGSVRIGGSVLSGAEVITIGAGTQLLGGIAPDMPDHSYWGTPIPDDGPALFSQSGATIVNEGSLTGGTGPRGADNVGFYFDGAPGGEGGIGGSAVTGSGFVLDNRGTITGGDGGNGGNGGWGTHTPGSGNYGGRGGAGVSGSNFTLRNSGTITGGNGGAGGIGGSTPYQGPTVAGGAGGVGVMASGGATISNSGTIAGTAGANAVELSGGGNMLIVEAGGSFTGNVVSAGGDTLALGGDHNFGLGNFFHLTTADASGLYQGFDHLAKTGASTWILTGADSGTRDWTVTGGVLRGNTDTIKGDVVNNATLVFEQAVAGTQNGAFSGSGTIILQGGGTLTLLGDSGSFAGQTTISAGTLQVGNGGNSGTFGGDIVNNAALVFNRSDDIGFAGDISGSGAMTKLGAGALTLLGDNSSFSGQTTISAGILQIGDGGNSGTLGGDIVNNAGLVFDRADASAYGGVVSGTGTLGKLGAGALTLTGTHSYGGATSVLGGTLLVDGSIASSSSVTVESGAALGGSGLLGDTFINAGATLAPGNSIGTITVDGDLNLAGGATVAIEINDEGSVAGINNDLVSVEGDVTIDPTARVRIGPVAGSGTAFRPTTTYTMLQATGAVNGAFGGVDDDFVFMDASLNHLAQEVQFTLVRNDLSFDSAAGTPNQKAAAASLSWLKPGDPLYDALLSQTGQGAQDAFDSISGEIHASGQQVVDQTFALFQSSLGTAGMGGGGGVVPLAYGPEPGTAVASLLAIDEATPEAPPVTQSLWLQPLAGRGTVEADGNAASISWWGAGLSAGYEAQTQIMGGTGRFGGSLGYITSGGEAADRRSTTKGQGGVAGVYGSWSDGQATLSGNLIYGAQHVSTQRNIVVGPIQETALADYWVHRVGLALEGSYGFALTDQVTVSPVGTLSAGWSGHNGATETGAGVLNAVIDPTSWWQLDTGLGVELAYETDLGEGGTLRLRGRALWEHGWIDDKPEQSLSLAGGGAPFSVDGAGNGNDRLKLGAGVDFAPGGGATVSLDYTATVFGGQSSHIGTAALKVAF